MSGAKYCQGKRPLIRQRAAQPSLETQGSGECDEISKRKNDTARIEENIEKTKKEIEKEMSDYATEYDNLEQEQADISAQKFNEINEYNEALEVIRSKICELEEWKEAEKANSAELKALDEKLNEAKSHEDAFCSEIESLTSILKSLGQKKSVSSEQLFPSGSSLPRCKPGSQAAEMVSSLNELRQTLIRRYAQSLSSECPVQ